MTILFRGEFFLADYISKKGNFNTDMISTVFSPEGWFDDYNFIAAEANDIATMAVTRRRGAHHDTAAKTYRYEFALIPTVGFLGSPEYLLNDCELKLSFDRSAKENAVVEFTTVTNAMTDYIEIKDCVAVSEWVSSPGIRNYFEQIDRSPIIYEFDDIDVLLKSIPQDETEIRFENIRGGNVPDFMFAALIPQSALTGTFQSSSTSFRAQGVKELNITLNGNSVNGYPLSIKNQCPVIPLHKFFDVTNRLYNVSSGEGLSFTRFDYNWIWSHKFESENTSQGWLGVSMKLTTGFTVPMTLVIWVINSSAISIDKFHQIEKINL